MPNLENLKKQAKRFVRWRREGKYTVAAAIRERLPRFAGMTDAQIMAHPFRLADAQELIARQYGFESWPALIEGSATMSTTPAPSPGRPVLTGAEPQLFVTDMDRTVGFFTEQLGFTVGFLYGEPAFYGQVRRDAVRLNLRCVDGPVGRPADEEDLLSASITVDRLKALFREFQERGVAFHQPLTREPWHAENQAQFIVADPDGNLLLFAGRTD
ncbi:VOC family protein [Phenylobacterium terrae]|uniref:VOC family protein n=1 Tax=Phenylobacterium terrae TaxID=2665495 RepID=A0ABW4N3G6_9CAUL